MAGASALWVVIEDDTAINESDAARRRIGSGQQTDYVRDCVTS